MLREDDLIVLLGAGCSAAAKIPTSERMLTEVHDLLEHDHGWKKFHPLYCCLRAMILRSDALQGRFTEVFNIERLAASLGEIEKRQHNVLYPFMESLNRELSDVAGSEFKLVSEFREKILERLKNWIQIPRYEQADYYRYFFDLASGLNYALRVFTFNYDLCLEKNIPQSKTLERGFDKSSHEWDWRLFESREEEVPSIYYYKMHGSIDWERDSGQGNIVREVQNTPLEPDLIFGTVNKLTSIDPYLFYAYEFRKYSLGAKIILIIGYSFADGYINGLLRQALENDKNRKLIAVMPKPNAEAICSSLGHSRSFCNQIVTLDEYAEQLLPQLTPNFLIEKAGIQEDVQPDPFEVA